MKVNSYGRVYDVTPVFTSYTSNGSLAIQLVDMEDGCPFAMLTVNLPDFEEVTNGYYAFVDTNNCPWAEDFIKDNNLGTPVGIMGYSGYCQYPLYRFRRDDK